MQILSFTTTVLHLILSFTAFFITPSLAAYAIEERQNAAGGGGGGAAVTSLNTEQAATTTWAASLTTVAGTTTTTWVLYTQTFNTSLGTWAYPTALSGTIGLGTITGTVG